MSNQELHEEELEVLHSIYEGDECFKELNPTTFQYKIGEDGHFKSFLLEIKWGDTYPEGLPDINLDAFYNKHISSSIKESIVSKVQMEAEPLLDSAMTYTLFEWAKENAEELTANCQEMVYDTEARTEEKAPQDVAKTREKREQLTKAQKRKMFDRLDDKGERPRGYNWVDIVKHLSQTGSSNSNT